MVINFLASPAVLLLGVTSVALVTSQKWRWSLLALGLQYLGVAILAAQSWSPGMAAVKLVGGWMACAVLFIAIRESDTTFAGSSTAPGGRVFSFITAGLAVLVVVSLEPGVTTWVPGAGEAQTWGSLLLIGLGLLHLGFSGQPARVVFALLTVLSGFEILYATVETSALVAGLLAATNLSLALAGAYLMVAPGMEEETG